MQRGPMWALGYARSGYCEVVLSKLQRYLWTTEQSLSGNRWWVEGQIYFTFFNCIHDSDDQGHSLEPRLLIFSFRAIGSLPQRLSGNRPPRRDHLSHLVARRRAHLVAMGLGPRLLRTQMLMGDKNALQDMFIHRVYMGSK